MSAGFRLRNMLNYKISPEVIISPHMASTTPISHRSNTISESADTFVLQSRALTRQRGAYAQRRFCLAIEMLSFRSRLWLSCPRRKLLYGYKMHLRRQTVKLDQ